MTKTDLPKLTTAQLLLLWSDGIGNDHSAEKVLSRLQSQLSDQQYRSLQPLLSASSPSSTDPALQFVHQQMKQGLSLPEALKRFEMRVSKWQQVCAVIREQTEPLLAYPLVLLVIFSMTFWIWSIYVVPGLMEMYQSESARAHLPTLSQWLFDLQHHPVLGWLIAAVLLAAVAALLFFGWQLRVGFKRQLREPGATNRGLFLLLPGLSDFARLLFSSQNTAPKEAVFSAEHLQEYALAQTLGHADATLDRILQSPAEALARPLRQRFNRISKLLIACCWVLIAALMIGAYELIFNIGKLV
ncbi:hypothetical protein [Permianibacter aggregans]|uniref:Type II secretory pathway component PulF n=1 Tax=Permianibacter aggregans TaxID=1510150 RepID=A0A4R6UQR4_9GAMM|nr:hypothetical protein [Permianibacter aggregans]QGX39180.1 hypothetical protein E2H98_05685 [Permianibacter aggregans]TDQ47605.1 hypothetical protein EV696_1097 [Permianibacter aggregans]